MLKLFSITLIIFISSLKSYSQNIDSVRYYLNDVYKRAPFSANILIMKKDQIVFEESFGYGDFIRRKPLTSKNSFQIASVSKQFTAYGIMLLKNAGALHYDSLVYKYMPTFPYRNITVRHLLTHSSGLPNFWNDIRPHLDTTKANGNKDVLEYLHKNHLPLQFQPGTNYQYADIGYDFLANIIEILSGDSFQNFIHNKIFRSLKMKNSFAYMVTDIRKIKNRNLAPGHDKEATSNNITPAHLHPKNRLVYYLGNFYGDGSVVTTARDLAIWNNALRECRLLSCDVQNESIKPFSENGQIFLSENDNKINYGFGWRIKLDTSYGKIAYHSGSHPGNRHMFYRMLDKDIMLIYLSNYEKPENDLIISKLISLL